MYLTKKIELFSLYFTCSYHAMLMFFKSKDDSKSESNLFFHLTKTNTEKESIEWKNCHDKA